eukprot:13046714-Alexandrium_andersonii.AAC.1
MALGRPDGGARGRGPGAGVLRPALARAGCAPSLGAAARGAVGLAGPRRLPLQAGSPLGTGRGSA